MSKKESLVSLALSSIPAKTPRSSKHFELLTLDEWRQIQELYAQGGHSYKAIFMSLSKTFAENERVFYKEYAHFYSVMKRVMLTL